MSELEFFAPCPRGLEGVCADELRAMRIRRVRPLKSGVAFFSSLEDAMRVGLWSRVASRVLLVLKRVAASDADELYAGVREIHWQDYFDADATIAVDANGTNQQLRNTQFTGLKVKDGICDTFRASQGRRPDVDPRHADVRINVSLHADKATVALDLAGESLHRRGYRRGRLCVAAPLKEALGAGMLMLAGWDGISRQGGAFVDPMCGSGTLAIEAAMIAGDRAPGALREHWCFEHWHAFDPAVWDGLLDEADERAEDGEKAIAPIVASDIDPEAIEAARACIHRIHLDDAIELSVADVSKLVAPHSSLGLVATNPPYGERLSTRAQLPALYASFASRLREGFDGYKLAVITSDPAIDAGMGLASDKVVQLFNGAIETPLHIYQIGKQQVIADDVVSHDSESVANPSADTSGDTGASEGNAAAKPRSGAKPESAGKAEPSARADNAVPAGTFKVQVGDEQMLVSNRGTDQFVARLVKVARLRRKWARRNDISSYRIYDADLPDYAVSIDRFGGAGACEGKVWIQVCEYEAPSEIDPTKAASRLSDVLTVIPPILGVSSADVFLKVRKHARGGSQYAYDEGGAAVRGITEEDGLLYEIDLSERLDCGLFLDTRLIREMIFEKAEDVRFCNLFAYTGTASVCAAAGGARSTTTVDLSQTYLDWARHNMQLNGFRGDEHEYVRADCRRWIDEQRSTPNRWDLIYVDPPTFSNSAKMGRHTFDVQRDHVELLIGVSRLLTRDGVAIFTCNLKRFEPDIEALSKGCVAIEDITESTIPEDFERTPKVHHCYLVKRVRNTR